MYHRKHKNSIDEAELSGCCGQSSQGKEPKGKEGCVYLNVLYSIWYILNVTDTDTHTPLLQVTERRNW